MKKRVFLAFILMFLFTLPLATAQFFQQAPQLPTGSFITEILVSDYFIFLALFTIFFGLTSALLRKFFQKGTSIAISFPLALLLAAGGMFSGFFDLTKLGIFAIILFFLLFAEIFLGVFGKKQGIQKSVLWLNLAVLAAIILIASLFGNYLSEYLALILWLGTVVGLLSLLFYFLSGTTSRERAAREEDLRERPNLWDRLTGRGRGPRPPRPPRAPRTPTPPTALSITIINPASDGQRFGENDNIPFVAQIFGGDEPFEFNIFVDGALRQRGNTSWAFARARNISLNLGRLAVGNHTITINVTDRNGQTANASVNIVVTTMTAPGTLRIDSITPYQGEQGQIIQVRIQGEGFTPGMTFDFGRRINSRVGNVNAAGNLAIVDLQIDRSARLGRRDVTAIIGRGGRNKVTARKIFEVVASGAANQTHVQVYVRDATTNAPINNATVHIQDSTGATVNANFMNINGMYKSINAIAPGNYQVTASAQGYTTNTIKGPAPAQANVTNLAYVQLSPAAQPTQQFTLTINATAAGVQAKVNFTINGSNFITSHSGRGASGTTYQIEMPQTVTIGGNNYTFRRWSDGNTSRARNVLLDRDITLIAEYASTAPPTQQFTLTVNAIANGSIASVYFKINWGNEITPYQKNLSTTTYNIEMPDTATILGKQHRFERWSDGNTSRARNVNIDRDVILIASYTQVQQPQKLELQVVDPKITKYNEGGVIPIRLHVIGGRPNYTYSIDIDGRKSRSRPSSNNEYGIAIDARRLGIGKHTFKFSVEDSTGATDDKEVNIEIIPYEMRIYVKVPANNTTLDLTKGGDIPIQVGVNNGISPFNLVVYKGSIVIYRRANARGPPISGFIKKVREILNPGQHILRFVVTDANESTDIQEVRINLIF